tara:strand:+ start:2559 stop:2945 length:387 start_codon:yes stop_codon:yes gene_type:complete
MINAAQAALGIGSIGRSISGQGRSGFEGINLKLDQIIEMQKGTNGSGGGAMPIEQPPIAPVGNLAATSAVPTGGSFAGTNAIELSQQSLRSGGGPETGGFDPLAQAASTEIHGDQYERDMSLQNRTLI